MLMNDPQTADELPTKIITFVGEAETDATINEVTHPNRPELFETVIFLHIQSILTMLMAHRLPTNCRRKYFICGRNWTKTQP